MDIEKIFALIDKAQASLFDRIEIQTQDLTIRLERQLKNTAAEQPVSAPAQEQPKSQKACEQSTEDTVFTPISGVFYARSNPEAEPYVAVGNRVEKGQPLCIIEAMKTMNEICAPKSGVIERIFIADSETVAAGDALFTFMRED